MIFLRRYALTILSVILISLFFVKNNFILETATDYTANIAKDSAAVYLSLRGINAALSFVEEIEVNASVIVASGSVQPFKVLEPVDDAVERMSSAIFYIGVVAATITAVLEFFGRYGFLVFGLALALQQIAYKNNFLKTNETMMGIIRGVRNSAGIILIALVSFFFSSYLSERASDSKWLEYGKLLKEISDELDELSIIDQMTIDERQQENVELQVDQEPEENTSDKSWKDSLLDEAGNIGNKLISKGQSVASSVRNATSGTMSTMVEKYNLAGKITTKFWERKDELVKVLTDIFALFIFKTFILPLLLFLFLYGSVRGTFSSKKS